MKNMSCGWIAGAARARWLGAAVAMSLAGCVTDEEDDETPSSTESEIAGGVDTWERPEIGMLLTDDGYMCTATLIRPNVVITAGHCTTGGKDGLLAGKFVIPIDAKKGTAFQTNRYFAFDTGGELDFAIVELTSSVPKATATPMDLAAAFPPLPAIITIYGYGCTNRFTQAGAGVKRKYVYTENGGGSNVLCPGDSGGPVIADNKIVAINSAYRGLIPLWDLFGYPYLKLNELNAAMKTWPPPATGPGTTVNLDTPVKVKVPPAVHMWDVAGHVRDQNLVPVPNVVVQVWGHGGTGAWKHYDSKTDAFGNFKVGGFIVKGGMYEVRIANNTAGVGIGGYRYPAFTSWLSHTRDQKFRADTALGSLAYLNQRAGSDDCAGPDTTRSGNKRCDFMYTTDANRAHLYPPAPKLLPVVCDAKTDPKKPRVSIPWSPQPRATLGYYVRVDHRPNTFDLTACTGGAGSPGKTDPFDRCVDGTTHTSLTVGPIARGVPYRAWVVSANKEGAFSQVASQVAFTCP